jgi:predicted ATPase
LKETLIIKNFGPIKDIAFELGKVNVLIGGQGTGKSTVARVIAMCHDYRMVLLEESKKKELFVDYQIDLNLKKETEIYFTSENFKVEIINEELFFYPNQQLNSLIIDSNKLRKELSDPNNYDVLESIFKNINENEWKISSLFGNATYYPAERILIPILNASSFELLGSKNSSLNYLISNFGRLFQLSRNKFKDYNFDFLGFHYHFTGEKDLLVFDNEFEIELKNSASGFQSAVTLLLPFYVLSQQNSNKIHIIEEPELSLFPATQMDLTRSLISSLNFGDKDRLFIATHSPYILTALNNLMYAWQVGQENREEVSKVISEKYWLNPCEVSAYCLSNGEAESIIDKETGLIEANRIDGVSDIINREFNDLFEVESSKKK